MCTVTDKRAQHNTVNTIGSSVCNWPNIGHKRRGQRDIGYPHVCSLETILIVDILVSLNRDTKNICLPSERDTSTNVCPSKYARTIVKWRQYCHVTLK